MKRSSVYRRRTKIVCTIGPATGSAAVIERLTTAGMNIARLNLSHGMHREHERYIQTVRESSRHLGIKVAILMDLPGPKYRVGRLKGGQASLKKGTQVALTTRPVEGDATLVPVSIPHLPQDVKAGDTILLDDGAMQLKVRGKEGT
ncbi:MAG: pyruvate kinase, partial [Dehalococcoidia bacterium]